MKKKKIYNPSDSRKRRYVSSMRNRILAGVVAAVTAATPAVTYAADFGGYGLLNILGTDTGTESVEDNSGTVEVSSVTDVEESVEDVTKLAEDSEKSGDETETKFLFINLSSAEHGKIILNEGEDDERRIKLAKQTTTDDSGNSKEEMMINVYDKDDVLISTESAADNNYIYVCEAEADRAVTAKVVPDDGYLVSKYSLQDKLIDGVDENVGFEETDSEFSFPVFMKDNMSLSIEFTKKEVKVDENDKNEISTDESSNKTTNETSGFEADTDAATIVTDDDTKENEPDLSVNEDKTVNEQTLEAIDNDSESGDSKPEDNSGDKNDITVNDVEPDLDSSTDGESSETTNENTDESNAVIEEKDESLSDFNKSENEDIVQPDMSTEEHFVDDAEGVDNLNASDFSSARLVLLSDSDTTIIDPEHVIGNYDDIYLMQYRTPAQAMNAYVYYLEKANAVEPDVKVSTASESIETVEDTGDADLNAALNQALQEAYDNDSNTEQESAQETEDAIDGSIMNETEMTSDDNAVAALSVDDTSAQAVKTDNVIALIDTGTSERANVIDRVSLIDDVLVGNGHGDAMADDIVSQNPNAKILSIRALGNDGYGSYSSVVSAIEYAINSNVDIINLSMYSKRTLATSILEVEIEKAVKAGIIVVGSAGNDGADVSDYIPGGIPDVYTIGAVNGDGVRRVLSNYGDLVDYYTVADSTSDAAALFTGYISANGLNAAEGDTTGLIFKTAKEHDGYENDDVDVVDKTPDTTKDKQTLFDPIIENYVKEHADVSYVGNLADDGLAILNVLDVKAMVADENELQNGETLYTINEDGTGFRFLTQQIGRVPVYDFNADSKYFVAFADVMHNDKNAKAIDIEVAQNNTKGIAIDGFYYDYNTGLLYIPKTAFLDESGTYNIGILQTQILYSISGYTNDAQWNSATYSVTEEADGTVEDTAINGDNIFLQGMSVQVGKHMDVNKMLVAVNGYPLEGKLYAYNEETGELELAFSSVCVQSVWVQAEKTDDAPDVEPGMKAAKSYTFKNMSFVTNNAIGVANSDNFFDIGKVWKNMKTKIGYSNDAGTSFGANNPKAYRGFVDNIQDDSYDVTYVQYVFGDGKANAIQKQRLSFTSEKKKPIVYDGEGLYCYWTCVLQLNTIGAEGWKSGTHYAVDFRGWPHGNPTHKVGNVKVVMECTHVDVKGHFSENHDVEMGQWIDARIAVKLISYEKSEKSGKTPWAVFALYTDKMNGQHGIGLIKVKIKWNTPATPTPTPTNTPTPTPSPTPVPPNVQIQKVSTASDEILDLSAYSKQGAEFTIYTDAACTNKLETLKTGTDGLTPVYTLPNKSASYWVKETNAPNGHKINDTPVKVDVSMPAQAGKIIPVKISDDPETVNLSAFVQKLSVKGNAIEGVVFEVKLYDGEYKTAATCPAAQLKKTWYLKSDTDGNVIFDTGHLADASNNNYRSDAFYKWHNPTTNQDEIVIPKGCTVTYQEVKAPSIYDIDDSVNIWEVEKDTTVKIKAKSFYNLITPCKINIRKLSEDGVTPLQGVEFELTFVKESSSYTDLASPSYTPLLKQGESIKGITDKDGYITWENLDQGEYQIVETKTRSDMTLLKDPINITLPITMTNKEALDSSAATDQGLFDEGYTNLWYFYEATFEVTNNAKFKMPMTGDNGFWKFGFIGFGTIAVLGTGLIIFDKKGKKQKHRKRVTKK